MKKCLILLTIVIAFNGLVSAATKDDIGTSGAQFLKLGAGARVAAMGDVFGAVADDSSAIYWNPAGLNQLKKKSVSIMHSMWVGDIAYDWVSYAQPTSFGAFGVGIQYLSYGTLKGMDETGLALSNFSPSDFAGNISYANKIGEVGVGLNVKYISCKIKESATAYAGDIGLMYKMMEDKLALGLAVQNIGTKLKFIDEEEQLPMNIKIGTAYKISDNWLVAVDANSPNDNAINIGAGTEYNYKLKDDFMLSGRAGYNTKTKDIDGLKGIAAGLGVGYKDLMFDYAFVPFGDLGNTHKISCEFKFGSDFSD